MPKRILVAGCGTGAEAFALRQRFPDARIVGVDFSEKSLAITRKRQRGLPRARQIRFARVDLGAKNFRKIAGDQFDLISCHGVLSYVPKVADALRNLADCLNPNGALYLGVNGSRHFSTTWRPALRALGLEVDSSEDGPALRQALKICEALADEPAGWMARAKPEYLGSDLFTPLLANLPLENWNQLGRAAGLHFLGSSTAQYTLRRVVTRDLYELLLPRSRAELHEVAERLVPTGFHRLVFARKPPVNPPWQDAAALSRWRVCPTKVLLKRPRTSNGTPTAFANFTISSRATNTIADLHAPRWLLKILQESDGKREVREILGGALPKISARSLRKHLYLLYLLAVINLRPPSA